MSRTRARIPLEVPAVLHPLGLLRLEQVLALVQIPKASFYKGMDDGRYPLPVRISARIVAWRTADILHLLESFKTVTEIDPNIAKAIAGGKAKRASMAGEVS